MKKIIVLVIAAVAFIASSVVANAQYRPSTLSQHRAGLEDENGHTLTDQEVFQLIGEDVYNQTYVGATKQYKTGKTLIWSGAGGLVGGAVLYGVGLSKIAGEVNQNSSKDEIQTALERHPGSAGMVLGGTLLMAAGAIALDAGIPLLIIGKKRLDWVEGQANAAKGYSLDLGATPYGVGLAVRF